MLKKISSTQNPLIKELVQLQSKSRLRKETGLCVVEGAREIRMAVNGGFSVQKILFSPYHHTYFDIEKLLLGSSQQPEIFEISREVHIKLATRESTEGMLALVRTPDRQLAELVLRKDNPLLLVAQSPEKPGNIGAMLRTADAAGVDAVLIADVKTDIFNANTIRSSIGAVFTVPVIADSSENIIKFLKEREIPVYCAELNGAVSYYDINYTAGAAIVVGTEDMGLTDIWLNAATKNIIIPMAGKGDSLNLSVSAGILLFECVRQRNMR
jgi:TrmH family RNA methyltransferase